MDQFKYSYNSEYQCLVKLSPCGVELQRMYMPLTDLQKVLIVLWSVHSDKSLIDEE